MSVGVDLELDTSALDSLDWKPCESPFHNGDPWNDHEGDGEYVVIFHECPFIQPGLTLRCARWMKRVMTLEEVRCVHCDTTFPRDEYVAVIDRLTE